MSRFGPVRSADLEGNTSIDPDDLDFQVKIDRGELILPNGNGNGANPTSGYNDKTYLRYKNTPSGILRARCRECRLHFYRRDRRAR